MYRTPAKSGKNLSGEEFGRAARIADRTRPVSTARRSVVPKGITVISVSVTAQYAGMHDLASTGRDNAGRSGIETLYS